MEFNLNLNPQNTIGQIKDMLRQGGFDVRTAKLVFNNGVQSNPIIFETDTYDNHNFVGNIYIIGVKIIAQKETVLPPLPTMTPVVKHGLHDYNIRLKLKITNDNYDDDDDEGIEDKGTEGEINIRLTRMNHPQLVAKLLENIIYRFGGALYYYLESENAYTEETHDLDETFDRFEATENTDNMNVRLHFEGSGHVVNNYLLRQYYMEELQKIM